MAVAAALAPAAFVTLRADSVPFAAAPVSVFFAVFFFFFFFARARRIDQEVIETSPRIETLSDRIKHGSIYRIGGGREDEMREEEEEEL